MTVQQQTTEQNKAQEMASQFASSSAPAKKASQSENPLKKVHSRFGEIEINLEKQINFTWYFRLTCTIELLFSRLSKRRIRTV